MLAISYARNARKYIEDRPAKHRSQIVRKIEELRSNPVPQDSRPLKGKLRPFLRVDIGEYRIVYRVEADRLMIAAVGRRNDDAIYREFERAKKR